MGIFGYTRPTCQTRYENINITFSATEENGLLMWKSQEDTVGNGDDFILVHIKDGRPALEYELGGGFYLFKRSPT